MVSLRHKTICIIMVILTFAVMVGTVVATGLSVQYDIAVGSVCTEDIYAPRTIVDSVTTNARRKAAADSVEDVYAIDQGLTDSAVEKVNKALSSIYSAREKLSESESNQDALIQLPVFIENNTYLSKDSFNAALDLTSASYEILAKTTPKVVDEIMTLGVTDVEIGLEAVKNKLIQSTASGTVYNIALELCEGAICENKTYDPIATQASRDNAASLIPESTYLKNQIICRSGEIITEAQYAILSDLGYVKGEGNIDIFHTVSFISLLLLALGLIVLYYIFIGTKEINATPFITTSICSLLCLLGSFIIFFAAKSSSLVMYLMPLSMIPALISLLLNSNLAMVVNVIIAILAGIQSNDISLAVAIIVAGSATGYFFSRVRRRSHLLPATIYTALAYGICHAALFIDTSRNIGEIFIVFALALAGGFLGGILTIGTIPFWESGFDVITPMKLGELSNPEHKLLKKLLLKAPGSYHHSLTVANMADSAAEACGANALLARVGAYYHDIGKLENPHYFKENQFGDLNPHDLLDPRDSASIITKHVSDGINLANQYHLPSAVKDIIRQHHGTTTVSFFLHKARETDPEVDSAIFTYPGPAPIGKEATIIMLADACEAAVRAMREHGDVDVEKVVNNIVTSRIAEGQLSGSSLSFADLDKVKASFVLTLEQYFHKRILYPENKEEDKKETKENG